MQLQENSTISSNNRVPPPHRASLYWLVAVCVLAALSIALIITVVIFAIDNNRYKKAPQEQYDFYITSSTLPTLYATLSAYQNKNPNTYMWFSRGNTISYQYSAPFIHYLSGQSTTNKNSNYNFLEIRQTVRNILQQNPAAKFRVFCDDQRSRILFDIFISAGIDFAALDVVLLSDGTASYLQYNTLTEREYTALAQKWQNYLQAYVANKNNPTYQHPDFPAVSNTDSLASVTSPMLAYLPTLPNVQYWIQNPEYLVTTQSNSLKQDRLNMNIIQKSPKAIYNGLDKATKNDYQKVVLASALLDNTDNLNTLEDAVQYFDSKLNKTDKDVVLILGTGSYADLNSNKPFIDQTLAFYTPTMQASSNKVRFKNKEYTSVDGKTIVVDGKILQIGELGVYLYFKGHPNTTLTDETVRYLQTNNITILPKRTPVEVLIWMYSIKVGGYFSSACLSCEKGQVEFIYYIQQQWTPAAQFMGEQGFFDDTMFFIK